MRERPRVGVLALARTDSIGLDVAVQSRVGFAVGVLALQLSKGVGFHV